MPSRTLSFACAVAVLILGARPTYAHAILLASQPAAGAPASAGHVHIVLRYNSRIDARRSRLTLTDANGQSVVLPIAAEPAPNVLTAESDLSPGRYSLRWQVLATDGHITRGDLPFTVAPSKAAQ